MDDGNLVLYNISWYITYGCVNGVLKLMECIEWCVERWRERVWCVFVYIYIYIYIYIY